MPTRTKPGPRITSPGWLVISKRTNGSMTLRFRYTTPEGRKEVWLGTVMVSNTPVLDVILENVDKLTVDEMIRLRDCDKSWSKIHP